MRIIVRMSALPAFAISGRKEYDWATYPFFHADLVHKSPRHPRRYLQLS